MRQDSLLGVIPIRFLLVTKPSYGQAIASLNNRCIPDGVKLAWVISY
ncbi:hypothetical protein H6F86_10120 [Phormidium sp. FACHB-592]|uniref:Uncharacterized protein n=1 Tax=Stenomitos frigidus AS-A4 TaxID=2933935 RepID=A0ABV0KTA1_9CYAN|nr:hypothetical protein [Phormidium sp. FACHB-592]MBD2074238.1 hypothetical protein [Phormidium sp. FACHB-592]